MSLDFKPFRDYILIRKFTAADKSGDLFLSDPRDPDEGVVLAIGEGRLIADGETLVPLEVKVGDIVAFRPGTGQEIDINQSDDPDFDPASTFLLLREYDIVGFRVSDTQTKEKE